MCFQRSSASPADRDKYRPRSHSPPDVSGEPAKKRRADDKGVVSYLFIYLFNVIFLDVSIKHGPSGLVVNTMASHQCQLGLILSIGIMRGEVVTKLDR